MLRFRPVARCEDLQRSRHRRRDRPHAVGQQHRKSLDQLFPRWSNTTSFRVPGRHEVVASHRSDFAGWKRRRTNKTDISRRRFDILLALAIIEALGKR